ncbi:MAG: NADH:flavin oxidoreductase [Deltaproteobacteria bacterium]|nr:NADH:flavin oxidoreductase [Deltaproteobacteria bacterium]
MDPEHSPPKPCETAFTPFSLGPVLLKNRFIKCATFEGMTPNGIPGEDLIRHHRDVAAGGAAMTTVAYCSVTRDGLTFEHQMHVRAEIEPGLARLCDAVHEQGCLAALQLGHAGYFASPSAAETKPIGASRVFNLYTLTFPRPMDKGDFQRLGHAFSKAADMAVRTGFDAIELHFGHGYLLSQFLSPYTNRRHDQYGGSLENRAKFPLEILEKVQEVLAGKKVALLIKMNLSDGFDNGLDLDEAVLVASLLEHKGAHGLVLSGGFVSKTPFYMLRGDVPVQQMVKNEKNFLRRTGLKMFGRMFVQEYPFKRMFFFDHALKIRKQVKLPLVLLGGIRSTGDIDRAMSSGFELVSMGRPLIHDPDLVKKMRAGIVVESPCEPCNLCVAEMEAGGIRCIHPTLGEGASSKTITE